jgi:hypothetical protein
MEFSVYFLCFVYDGVHLLLAQNTETKHDLVSKSSVCSNSHLYFIFKQVFCLWITRTSPHSIVKLYCKIFNSNTRCLNYTHTQQNSSYPRSKESLSIALCIRYFTCDVSAWQHCIFAANCGSQRRVVCLAKSDREKCWLVSWINLRQGLPIRREKAQP